MRRTRYTQEQLLFLKDNSQLPRRELTAAFNKKFQSNRSYSSITQICSKNGWACPVNTGRFQKGSTPFNKGKKGFISANVTSFKKGNRPKNARSVGTITRRKEKSGYWYQRIKIAEPNIWKMLHVYIWEQRYGEIPKGKFVVFKDKNPLNVSIENLMLVSRSEHARLNQKYANIDGSLKETALQTIRLKKAIREKLC